MDGMIRCRPSSLTLTALAAAVLLAAGCGAPPAPQVKRYALRGEIVSLDPQNKVATVKHEKIEGWMEAMTMDFPVRDDAGWKRLTPGALITATVFVDGMDYHLGEIQVVERKP